MITAVLFLKFEYNHSLLSQLLIQYYLSASDLDLALRLSISHPGLEELKPLLLCPHTSIASDPSKACSMNSSDTLTLYS